MNFLCPSCRTPLPRAERHSVVPCGGCGVEVDLARVDTSPGTARLWPDLDLAGESLGELRLLRRLGAGGMGIVYEAEAPTGPCAVKVLSALLAAEPQLRARFRREAAALRAVDHPGVVRILAEGEERGFSWYSMERVHGPDLRARLKEGPLPAPEVEDLARRLLPALAEVHARGIVHRDVKPANILLAESGPKLCDFGIARLDGSTTLTESAALMGSLRYMAPEQRFGRTDARSDLYALGVVLHEALAGGVPGEAPLPRRVPRKLLRLLARLLAERPGERPAGALAALAVLDAPLVSPRLAAVSVAALIALALGGAYFALLESRGALRATDAVAPQAQVAPPPPPAQEAAPRPKQILPLEKEKGAFPVSGTQSNAAGLSGTKTPPKQARPSAPRKQPSRKQLANEKVEKPLESK